MPTGIRLTDAHRRRILERLDSEAASVPQALTDTWTRRLYCPMLIHDDAFVDVRRALAARWPGYTIVFDVVFDSRGNQVPWHCDYESIGPFRVDAPLRAIVEHHFVSVHFNLTPDGGRLRTLDWPLLSYVHYMIIVWCGIYSRAHTWLAWLSWPLLALFARTHTNEVGAGNCFDNMRLHTVTAGRPRTSYVVRLVRDERVVTDRATMERAVARTKACAPFAAMLDRVPRDARAAHELAWSAVRRDEAEGGRTDG